MSHINWGREIIPFGVRPPRQHNGFRTHDIFLCAWVMFEQKSHHEFPSHSRSAKFSELSPKLYIIKAFLQINNKHI
jgi:hypothetical protein